MKENYKYTATYISELKAGDEIIWDPSWSYGDVFAYTCALTLGVLSPLAKEDIIFYSLEDYYPGPDRQDLCIVREPLNRTT